MYVYISIFKKYIQYISMLSFSTTIQSRDYIDFQLSWHESREV